MDSLYIESKGNYNKAVKNKTENFLTNINNNKLEQKEYLIDYENPMRNIILKSKKLMPPIILLMGILITGFCIYKMSLK